MTLIERLLRHDAWTTRSLLSISAELPDATLDREFDLGHRSLRRTFGHIIWNMECWCDLMRAWPRPSEQGVGGADELHPEPHNSAGSGGGRTAGTGAGVVEEGREDEMFVDDLDVPPRRKPLGAGLVHVATHGMHHRAQCLYLLRQLGVKNLIERDAMSWELAFLGKSEWPLG